MQVLRGGHRAGVTVGHIGCIGSTWYIETDEALIPGTLQLDVPSNTITLPVRRGDVLLLNNLVPHRSLPNNSSVIRWSIDLRWQDAHKPSGYRAKPVLQLTKADDRAYKPQWDEWAQQDRQKIVADTVAATAAQQVDKAQLDEQKDPFDTHIVGSANHSSARPDRRGAVLAVLLSLVAVLAWGLSAHAVSLCPRCPLCCACCAQAVDGSLAAAPSQPPHRSLAGAEGPVRAGESGGHHQELSSPPYCCSDERSCHPLCRAAACPCLRLLSSLSHILAWNYFACCFVAPCGRVVSVSTADSSRLPECVGLTAPTMHDFACFRGCKCLFATMLPSTPQSAWRFPQREIAAWSARLPATRSLDADAATARESPLHCSQHWPPLHSAAAATAR